MGFGRRQVSWLPGLPLRAFPGRRRRIGGCARVRAAVGIPGHSGGSAPDSHRLPFTTDRMNVGILLHMSIEGWRWDCYIAPIDARRLLKAVRICGAACSKVRPALIELHRRQQVARFSAMSAPPLDTGMTWSSVAVSSST